MPANRRQNAFMSSRVDRIVWKTRKPCACTWCGQEIPRGGQKLVTTYLYGDHYIYRLWLHPECWRAEYIFCAANPDDDYGIDLYLVRGSLLSTNENPEELPQFTDIPVNEEELLIPYQWTPKWVLPNAILRGIPEMLQGWRLHAGKHHENKHPEIAGSS